MTRVVNIRYENADVYIGRPSKWGNPFRIGRDGSRAEVVCKHMYYLLQNTQLLAAIRELKDKTLGCFCAPELCHGDNLAEVADAIDSPYLWHILILKYPPEKNPLSF